MDPRYYTYFRERLDLPFELEAALPSPGRRGAWPYERMAHYAARGAVEEGRRTAEEVAPDGLRPDAEFLLYLLALEFVARPVIAVEGIEGPQLSEDLTGDIGLLVRQAVEMGDPGEQVSAHRIIDALSARWADLRTSSANIWGP